MRLNYASPRKLSQVAKKNVHHPLDLEISQNTTSTLHKATPTSTDGESSDFVPFLATTKLVVDTGEAYFSDYQVHVVPSDDSSLSLPHVLESNTQASVVVQTGLLSRIELLEARINELTKKSSHKKPVCFGLEIIAEKDMLIRFYTGFQSYEFLMAFYEFLGPSLNKLQYWGTKVADKKRKIKLDSLNQLFLTLIKLRFNLREKFGC